MQRIIIIPSDLMTTDDSLSNSVITKKQHIYKTIQSRRITRMTVFCRNI